MAESLGSADLDKLVLAWLAMRLTHEGYKPPQRASLVNAVKAHLSGTGLTPESVVRQSLARLKSSGNIEVDTALMLSAAGEKKALALLNVPNLPARTSWKSVLTLLMAAGLGVKLTQDVAKRLGRPESLAALVLQKQRNISGSGSLDLAEVGSAIAWRELGVESTEPFTLNAVLRILLEREGQKVPKGTKKAAPATADLIRRIAANDVGAPSGHRPLQVAVVRRWMQSGASVIQGGDAPVPITSEAKVEAALEPLRDSKIAPSGAPKDAATLRQFAKKVNQAAHATKTGRYGEHKVFISHVWTEFCRIEKAPADLQTFKEWLVQANQADFVALSRADLVEVMSREDVTQSKTESLGATFHFLLVD